MTPKANDRDMANTEDSFDSDGNIVIGISLASEAHTCDRSHDVVLGVIHVKPNMINLANFRQIMCVELPTLPVSFVFLTRQGWPIGRSQEGHIKVKQVMCFEEVLRIRRSYEKPRVGIRTQNGTAVGFVFVDFGNSVEMLRTVIQKQLGRIYCYNGTSTYQFIDRNGWPLTCDQESNLAVIDLIQNSTIVIQTFTEANVSNYSESELSEKIKFRNSRAGLKNALTFQYSTDQVRQYSVDDSTTSVSSPKQVLISYVRAEAAEHAVKLKESLLHMGCCSVYLVKLADMLSKLIIPVSFIESWPPKCLAIQFATTQFISWRCTPVTLNEEGMESDVAEDVSVWDDDSIRTVAKQVLERIQMHQLQTAKFPFSQITPKLSTLKSCPFSLPEEFSALSQPREGQPMIVISVHPQETLFGDELKTYLESFSYEVFCSTQLWSAGSANNEDNKEGSEDELFSQEDKMSSSRLHGSDNETFLSQLSQMSMSQDKSPSTCSRQRNHRLLFQEKTDEAGVILVVMSKKFAESRTSRMQIGVTEEEVGAWAPSGEWIWGSINLYFFLKYGFPIFGKRPISLSLIELPICEPEVFYCEHRKRVIPVMLEDFCMPSWMSMLIGTGGFEDARSKNFKESLLTRIQKAVDKNSKPELDTEEAVRKGIQQLQQQLPQGIYVYISGGTKFYNKESETICKAIGNKLAEIDDLSLVTGGFTGVGEITSKAYHEKRQDLTNNVSVYHVLPHKDEKDHSKQTNQLQDGSFMPVSFGTTVFCGYSVRERETIVARVLDLCILIEGGPGAAHEAEQFSWNGHVVIPVKITGGAAGGKFNVPEKIFKKPCGVSANDWAMLSNRSASPKDIAAAVAHMVCTLKERFRLDLARFTSIKRPESLKRTSKHTSIDKVDKSDTKTQNSVKVLDNKKRKVRD